MTPPLVLDIETLPLEASMAAPYPRDDFSPPANYKNPEAIDGWYVKDEARWHSAREKECSLNPRLGRILAFGAVLAGRPETARMSYAEQETDEPNLLRDAWEYIAQAEGRVVTWNGSFDLRFLVTRSLALNVTPLVPASTIRAWFKRYDVFQHFDVKAVLLQDWNARAAGEGLDEWAKFFGLKGKPQDIDGSAVAFLYHEGQHDTIKEYCASDRDNTEAMFQRLVPFYGGN